jgi:hypothetical protein
MPLDDDPESTAFMTKCTVRKHYGWVVWWTMRRM